MSLAPLIAAPFVIQLHVVCAVLALLLGPLALFRNRRDRLHKTVGYVWVAALSGLAVSGLFIESAFPVIGPFGPIHLLCFYALWGVGSGVYWARRRDIPRHRAAMRGVWFGAVGGAGLFTLLPGRLLHEVLFGATPALWPVAIGAGALALVLLGGVIRPWKTSS